MRHDHLQKAVPSGNTSLCGKTKERVLLHVSHSRGRGKRLPIVVREEVTFGTSESLRTAKASFRMPMSRSRRSVLVGVRRVADNERGDVVVGSWAAGRSALSRLVSLLLARTLFIKPPMMCLEGCYALVLSGKKSNCC